MKKCLCILVITSIFFLSTSSCGNRDNKEITTSSEFHECEFEKVVYEDMFICRNGDFYGSVIEFDTNILLDSAKIIKITDLFEQNGECIQINHISDGTITNSTEDMMEFKGSPINYDDSVGISLKGILNIVRSDSSYKWIDTRKILLQPTKGGSALYVIGDGILYIDAQNGITQK